MGCLFCLNEYAFNIKNKISLKLQTLRKRKQEKFESNGIAPDKLRDMLTLQYSCKEHLC